MKYQFYKMYKKLIKHFLNVFFLYIIMLKKKDAWLYYWQISSDNSNEENSNEENSNEYN